MGWGGSLLGCLIQGPEGRKRKIVFLKLIKRFSHVKILVTSNYIRYVSFKYATLFKSVNNLGLLIEDWGCCILVPIMPCCGTTFWVFPFELKRNWWRHHPECPLHEPVTQISEFPSVGDVSQSFKKHLSVGNYISHFRTFVGNVIWSTFLNIQRENIAEVVRLLPVLVLANLHEQMTYLDI